MINFDIRWLPVSICTVQACKTVITTLIRSLKEGLCKDMKVTLVASGSNFTPCVASLDPLSQTGGPGLKDGGFWVPERK